MQDSTQTLCFLLKKKTKSVEYSLLFIVPLEGNFMPFVNVSVNLQVTLLITYFITYKVMQYILRILCSSLNEVNV